jgi:predicted nucleotide-binding protein
MAKKNTRPPEPAQKPILVVPREEAKRKIQIQIDKGGGLLARPLSSINPLNETRQEYYRWDDYNYELLNSIFNNDQHANQYRMFGVSAGEGRTLEETVEKFHEDVKYCINRLESMRDRLDLIPEDLALTHSITISEKQQVKPSNKVFVVHGHNEAAKLDVARFLEKLDLDAIILHERSDFGQTIIEKFETNADVGFAVVLLTPDDVGASKADFDSKKSAALKQRARQNVIFELGFFMGKLGRQRVRALMKGDVDILSDIQGVIYTPMDSHGAWRFKLAKEMKDSGIDVDLMKVY